MKDRNGKGLRLYDPVRIAGDPQTWIIVAQRDYFGDVVIESKQTKQFLSRPPTSLTKAK